MSDSFLFAIIAPALLPIFLTLMFGIISKFGKPHFVATDLPNTITIVKHAWPPFFSFAFTYVYGLIPNTNQLEEWLIIPFHKTYKRMAGFSVHQIESGVKIISAHPLSANYHPDKTVFEKADAEFDAIIEKFKIREMVEKYLASPD